MTREEALDYFKKRKEMCLDDVCQQAENMAIKALERYETVTEFADRCRECGARYGKLLKQAQKTGHWIEVAKYSDGKHEIECSECESHIFDRGHANSYVVKEKYKYCPRCGAKMKGDE